VGLVWFARYCGKMYSRHLFSYGGLSAGGYVQTEQLQPPKWIITWSELGGKNSRISLLKQNGTERQKSAAFSTHSSFSLAVLRAHVPYPTPGGEWTTGPRSALPIRLEIEPFIFLNCPLLLHWHETLKNCWSRYFNIRFFKFLHGNHPTQLEILILQLEQRTWQFDRKIKNQ